MSIYKPKNSPYFHFDFVWKGRRFHGSTGAKTRRAAERVEETERAKARNGGNARPPITLDEACGLYEDKAGDLPSWNDSERTIGILIEAQGAGALLSEITQRDLLALVAKRRNGRVNASVNREIEVWRAIWRWAAKARYDVGEMPDWGALMLKVVDKAPRELSAAEETALFEEIRGDLYDFCDFALKAGWRKSEVMGLRWSDVDLGARTAGTRIKGGDVVRRPLTQDMLLIIANQPKVGPFVFTYKAVRTKSAFVDKLGRKQPARKKGERYPMTATVIRKPWAAALANAGVEDFRFHDLRHTRGTRILRATGNLKAAQRALAHKSIKTTLRYAHATDDDVRDALDASDVSRVDRPNTKHASARKAD
ncbi:integrase [Sphingomonas aquatilis NBRC 16722]|uniref:Integrase n=1 Tax=Sphingomonas aquatilis TaxID=93063 RepID=A0AAW3TQG9_9SPHN|nr:site-specific integrase [Sphingomonas aquatilis]MBB3875280.1 integrase [Sphingomonas aquatilis]GEM72050.1 integrase [Sphingomonas aquatilis NBRC 16722]